MAFGGEPPPSEARSVLWRSRLSYQRFACSPRTAPDRHSRREARELPRSGLVEKVLCQPPRARFLAPRAPPAANLRFAKRGHSGLPLLRASRTTTIARARYRRCARCAEMRRPGARSHLRAAASRGRSGTAVRQLGNQDGSRTHAAVRGDVVRCAAGDGPDKHAVLVVVEER